MSAFQELDRHIRSLIRAEMELAKQDLPSMVEDAVKKRLEPNAYSRWTEKEEDELVRQVNEFARDAALKFGRSEQAIWIRLRRIFHDR